LAAWTGRDKPLRFLWAGLPLLLALAVSCQGILSSGSSGPETGCPGGPDANPSVLLCEDFEDRASASRWNVGSRGSRYPASEFVQCEDVGFHDRCAGWSNDLAFDGEWGFWGYDSRLAFTPQSEFYVRWYQYISDPYDWGTLEDKSVLLHDPGETIMAYVGTSRNHLPVVTDSGPGRPFVANYQDLDWAETDGRFTHVNRFQNQGANLTLQPGKWYLFEWYIKLNTPGVANGVTRLWIDEASEPIARQTLRMQHTDMRWLRSGDAGKQIGLLRLTVYHQRCDSTGVPNTCPPNGPETLTQYHRWDDIVVSRSPVGPRSAAGAAAPPSTAP
jgi:hypothetical protein